jgi:hypothetical protein
MKPGDIIELPFDCSLLAANLNSWQYCKKSYLLCVHEMPITAAAARAVALVVGAQATAAAAVVTAVAAAAVAVADAPGADPDGWTTVDKIYKQAKEELKQTKEIQGYNFWSLEGKCLVWLSHYDVEFLKNHNQKTI